MNLNENEEKIFNALKKGCMTMDELTAMLGVPRQAVTVRMKYLAAKVAPSGWIIQNKNKPQGRGRKAIYEMTKKF